MRLVLAKKSDLKGAFLLGGDPADLRKIKAKKVIHPFVKDDGHFGDVAATFKDGPIDASDLAKFQDSAEAVYTLHTSQDPLVMATQHLKGSRITPTTFTVSKVTDSESGKLVEGRFEEAYDPRLPYLDTDETTEFGSGEFDPDAIFGVYDGTYAHLHLSKNAESIGEVAERQQSLFNSYIKEPTAPVKAELERTMRLLKPHAHEIYRIDGDRVYYINKVGRWLMHSFPGIRHIDIDDRVAMRRHLSKAGVDESGLRNYKEMMHKSPVTDRTTIDEVAPLLHRTLQKTENLDQQIMADRKSYVDKIKPTDAFDSLPGLKDHVELFPHQAFVLSHFKDRERLPADVDPGGGKTLIMVCDILRMLKENPSTRPLIVMPESLLGQVAAEIKHFSELNPWIINTESVRRWKNGDFETFLKDAIDAPPNTVFLTSYNWISRTVGELPNGRVYKIADPTSGQERLTYGTAKYFPRVDALLNELKVNAVYRDECHLMRNESNISRAATSLARVPIVRDFTGTIMPGNLMDVTGFMGSLHSGVFGTNEAFLKKYSENGTPNNYKADAPKSIRGALREFGVPQVRRTAWASLLPKVHEFYHFVKFTPSQQKAYEGLLENTLKEIEADPSLKLALERMERELANGEPVSSNMVLARFTPLEIFLNSPADAKPWTKVLKGADAISPKAAMVSKIAKEHLAKPESGKVLVFVQFKDAAKNLLENLDPSIQGMADYYEGGMADVLNRFKNPESNLKILIAVDATLRAGHNLQVANCIIHADSLWTPGEDDQRNSRSARLKQTRSVDIHRIIVRNSAEMLKIARSISAEHMIAKANSDFEDQTVLPQIDMTMNGMRTFRTVDQLKPFISRKAAMQVKVADLAVKDREKFGIRPVKPRSYQMISDALPEAKNLEKVPSNKTFVGDSKSIETLVDKELTDLPLDPHNPRIIKFNLQQWDDDWYVTVWRTADPQGYVRRLGFKLQRHFWMQEVPSKGGAYALLKKIEAAGFKINNQAELDDGLHSMHRLLRAGQRGAVRRSQQEAKQLVAASFLAKVEAKKKETPSMQTDFHFATIDGFPVVFTDNIMDQSQEARELKKLGFKLQQPFWYYPTTRSNLMLLLRKIQTHNDLRIAEWDEFAMAASKVFMGINLNEFDSLSAGGGT